MSDTTSAVLLVAGPTASGKSALAAHLAAELNGVVINCDAMQVYRDLPILTAQPDATLQAQATHMLYAMIDPGQAFSAGQWLAAAKAAIVATRQSGKRPVICGGTGMYFQALLKGLADIPAISDELRAQLRADYTALGEQPIRARLAQHDPEAAQQIERGDQLRLLRALEIVLATGKTQRAWQENTVGGIGTEHVLPILLLPSRDALYAGCDRRFIAMLERGAVAEVQELAQRKLPNDLPAMKTIGIREIMAFTAGLQSWDDTVALAQQSTRNYAKRQMTWFRNQWLGNKIGFRQPVLTQYGFFTSALAGTVMAESRRWLELKGDTP